MPVYEYNCQKCKHEFEVFYTSISKVEQEEPEESCPKCGSKEKDRLINRGTSFQLKGTGWYKDRYGGGRGR